MGALSVPSHHRAWPTESVPADRAPTIVWGRRCNAATRQSAELAEDCVGWMGVGTWGTIAAERGELRRAFGLVVQLLVCAPLRRIPASKVLPNALSSDHLMRRNVRSIPVEWTRTFYHGGAFLFLSPGVVEFGGGDTGRKRTSRNFDQVLLIG
jgi:hypothetical protein